MIFGILVSCFLLITAVTGRNIYVSRYQHSSDTKTCGNLTQPCKSLQHAIDMTRDFDTILLDANYEYHHNSLQKIKSNIKITSFNNGTLFKNYTTVIFFNMDDGSVFNLEGDFTIEKLIVKGKLIPFMDEKNIFNLGKRFGNLRVVDTKFDLTLEYEIAVQTRLSLLTFAGDEKQLNWKLEFKKVYFVSHNSHSTGISCEVNRKKNMKNKQETLIDVNFTNCTFENLTLSFYGGKSYIIQSYFYFADISVVLAENSEAFVNDSVFHNSSIECVPGDIDQTRSIKLFVTGSIFDGSRAHWCSKDFQLTVNDLIYDSQMLININSCTFKNSIFGSVSLNLVSGKLNNVTFSNNKIEDFISISKNRAGALTVIDSDLAITNSSFSNNSAPPSLPGSISSRHSDCEPPCMSLNLSNTVITAGAYPLSLEYTVMKMPPDTPDTGLLSFYNTTLQCPINHLKILKFLDNDTIVINCKKCNNSFYNVGPPFHIRYNRIPQKSNEIQCYPCPYQASCVEGIRSKGNYWGYSNNSGAVHFIPCPPSYCCLSLQTCASYNTCIEYRHGRLCGDCLKGHTISLLGSSKCVLLEKCNSRWLFWLVYFTLAILCCLFLMYFKDVFLFIGGLMNERNEINEVNNTYQLLAEEDDGSSSNLPPNKHVSGLIKIMFFFYQTAAIIRINASAKNKYTMPFFIDLLSSFFNIKIDIKTSTPIHICPLQTDNMVLIEFLKTSLVLTCLALLFILILLISGITKFIKQIWVRNSCQKLRALCCRMKCAYIQLLLLGYAAVAMFCLQAVHCIDIQGISCLYLQASTECYKPWQNFIFSIIVVWVVPFPIAIYFNCCLLRSFQISPNQFILASTFPPFSLWNFLSTKKSCIVADHSNEETRRETENILSLLNEPFKASSADGNQLIWEPVLLYRRLFLIICFTFLLSPIQKLYPVGLLLLIFTIHDALVQPFEGKSLNKLQNISFHLLGLLALINLFWAFSNDVDLLQDTGYKVFGEIFLLFELVLLLSPIIICFVYIFFYKFGRFIFKLINRKQE